MCGEGAAVQDCSVLPGKSQDLWLAASVLQVWRCLAQMTWSLSWAAGNLRRGWPLVLLELLAGGEEQSGQDTAVPVSVQ